MNLSVCIIYRIEDSHYLHDCLASLPPDCEVILVRTTKSNKTHNILLEEKTIEETGQIFKHYEYLYEIFSFSDFKNFAFSKATREWVLNIDADERLQYIPSEWQQIDKLSDEIGGLICWVTLQVKLNQDLTLKGGGISLQVRIIRNKPNFYYIYKVHEDIVSSIVDNNYKLMPTYIQIKHIGYNVDDREIIKKLWRNARLLIEECNERTNNHFLHALLFETLQELRLSGILLNSTDYKLLGETQCRGLQHKT